MVSTRAAAGGAAAEAAPAAAAGAGVNVNVLPAVADALERCEFFALDCEMTGLFLEQNRSEYLDDVQDRYEKMCESTKAFIITQYGLACFERRPGGASAADEYVARTFNFWIFPQPAPSSLGGSVPESLANRRFTCEAGSLAFLSDQGFDFNTCIGQGIPFMPVRQRDGLIAQIERARERGASDQFSNQARVDITSDDDRAFVTALEDEVAAWLEASPGDGAPPELVLPPTNAFRRLLTYQALGGPRFTGEGHRGFVVRKVEQRNRGPLLVLLRAPTPEDAAALERQQYDEQLAAVHDAAGFAAVFELMRRSGKPAVGHNLAFDLAYSLFSFGDGWLPSTWRDYRQMARAWLPGGVNDTKYLSRRP